MVESAGRLLNRRHKYYLERIIREGKEAHEILCGLVTIGADVLEHKAATENLIEAITKAIEANRELKLLNLYR
jgi:hypothetical protein